MSDLQFFYAEKEIEHWLEEGTRSLLLPGGSKVSIRAFRLTWINYDKLIEFGGCTRRRIVTWAIEHGEREGVGFREAFIDLVAHLSQPW